MEIITKVLVEAFQDQNLSYAILMDLILALLYLFNVLLGTIIGTKESRFDIKKFFFGIAKALCLLLIVVGVCYILNVFTITINMLGGFITISTDVIGVLEVLVILVTQIIDIANECLEKIKAFRSLKYISYDEISKSDGNVQEPVELKG